eukprot:TRINITY_DN7218_c0_g1_i3.p1 TRINITY_DN7218_c0_g1~~TRINITY_DN7218_c0_g1_i3.p1  ORF type:complete len:417 (+),score=88.78 TRINITY_DN7218_c0_g1_i3:218-1468(+)
MAGAATFSASPPAMSHESDNIPSSLAADTVVSSHENNALKPTTDDLLTTAAGQQRRPRSASNAAQAATPADDEQNVISTALVIPNSFFEQAIEESRNVVPPPAVNDDHLFTFSDTSKGALPSWRTLLQSPLGSFLSGVQAQYPFIQLAGHKGNFISGQGGIIYKKSSTLEKAAYEALMKDNLKDMVPLYFKTVSLEDESDGMVEFLELQDLLGGFTNPSVMDVKMGLRTFLESEVTKTKRRMDLLGKMLKLEPDEPSEEEKEKGITKLRYMMFREKLSSTNTLGLRVEAIKLADEAPRNKFQRVKMRSDVFKLLESFFPSDNAELRRTVRNKILQRLNVLRHKLLDSAFFKHHELIGSSLLFIYDSTGKVGVWMIDFGKTSPVEHELSHDIPWRLGTQEDGYLIGLDNLVTMIGEC